MSLLALPLLALPVFWLWPLSIAPPIYAAAAAAGLLTHAYAIRAMRKPVETGAEGMLGATGRVMRVDRRKATLLVRGEPWSAEAEGAPLGAGDLTQVVGIEGLTLKVRRVAVTG